MYPGSKEGLKVESQWGEIRVGIVKNLLFLMILWRGRREFLIFMDKKMLGKDDLGLRFFCLFGWCFATPGC